LKNLWAGRELNPRHEDFQSCRAFFDARKLNEIKPFQTPLSREYHFLHPLGVQNTERCLSQTPRISAAQPSIFEANKWALREHMEALMLDMNAHTFIIYGRPVPASRPRVQQCDRRGRLLVDRKGRRIVRRYYLPVYDRWKQMAALRIEHLKTQLHADPIPKTEAIGIEVRCYFKPPRKRLADQWCPADVGDIDNLQKAILDALQGAFIEDDCAVCQSSCEKRYAAWSGEGAQERIEVAVCVLSPREVWQEKGIGDE